jgi:hypothetical protein
MIDSTEYDSLVVADAEQAARVARAFILELLLLGAKDRQQAEWQLAQIAP